MRAGVRFAGLMVVGTAVIAGPASAKPCITEATISREPRPQVRVGSQAGIGG